MGKEPELWALSRTVHSVSQLPSTRSKAPATTKRGWPGRSPATNRGVDLVPMPSVLLVDDEYPILVMIREILEAEGYPTMLASHGRAALEHLEREQPDLILADIMMPFCSGIELCQSLKGDPRTCGIPVILMSSRVHQPSGACPYDAFLAKPFEIDTLLTVLHTLVRR